MPDDWSWNAPITTTSGLISGTPWPERASCDASPITRTSSRVTMLSISDDAPARRTMALEGEPEATRVA